MKVSELTRILDSLDRDTIVVILEPEKGIRNIGHVSAEKLVKYDNEITTYGYPHPLDKAPLVDAVVLEAEN